MPNTACPECEESVFVDAESEQGDLITCDECGAKLELVGLDPIELDITKGERDRDYDDYDENDFDSERF